MAVMAQRRFPCRVSRTLIFWPFALLYAFISLTFQGWIWYRSFCSGRTPEALVKTIKYSNFRIILVIPVRNLTLHLTLPYLPYLTIPCRVSYLTLCLTLPYHTLRLTLPYLRSYLTLHLTLTYILPYLTLCLTLPYFLPYLPYFLPYLPYILPYILPYLTLHKVK